MRLTPAQMAMKLLLGDFVALFSIGDLKTEIQRGREWLVEITKQDFGYDALQWHEYLWSTNSGAYKWNRRKSETWARKAQAAMNRPEWGEAVRELEDR